MRLYLINPRNPAVAMGNTRDNRFNKYRIWKPLGLLVIARLTPSHWDVTVIDENLRAPDYDALPRPDLVGLTAFTSQAYRAYELAAHFRSQRVPVVMGGIHATMCLDEALGYADTVVTGEAEPVWQHVIDDFQHRALKQVYNGGTADMDKVPAARHELLPSGYAFGSVQTARGCPLNCSYCSVSAFNGRRFRRRPVAEVVDEFKQIKEKYVLIVDDNLIGTNNSHTGQAKELFRAMIDAKIKKKWICQVTINMGEDEELVSLAGRAGCVGALLGFETPTDEGLVEINKKFNIRSVHSIRSSCRTLQRHGIVAHGAFIIGLDVDCRGVGQTIAEAAMAYGLDGLGVTMLTPLPGTDLWRAMEADGRIVANSFPHDWKYYTLAFPVARYMNLTWTDLIDEWLTALRIFYSYPRIVRRGVASLVRTHKVFPVFSTLVGNLVFRRNLAIDARTFKTFDAGRGARRHSEVTGAIADRRLQIQESRLA